MQIFRPFKDHNKSARWLCDARLNKQVLESFQINNFCFRALDLLDDGRPKNNYINHPVVRSIFNEGRPYLPDHWNYMWICNSEWINRGRLRNSEFMGKMLKQKQLIFDNSERFSWEPMEEYFRFGDKEIYGEDIYKFHRALLNSKWRYGKTVAKCSINNLKKDLINL
jgi:hypothetical protein